MKQVLGAFYVVLCCAIIFLSLPDSVIIAAQTQADPSTAADVPASTDQTTNSPATPDESTATSTDTTTTSPSADATGSDDSTATTTDQTPAEPEETGLDMDFPLIGTVTMYPFTQADNTTGLRTYFPAKGKKAEWGPLMIGNGRFEMIDNKLRYFADASLFGSKVTLGIKDVQLGSTEGKVKKYKKLVFEVQWGAGNPPTLELIPGAKISLASVDVVLEQTKPLQLVANTTLFNQPIALVFIINKEQTNALAQLKAVPLIQLIPQVTNTPLEGGQVTQLTLTVKNIVSSKKEPLTFAIKGKADLSSTPGLEESTEEADSAESEEKKEKKEFTIDIQASKKEQTIKGIAKEVTIPGLGVLHDVKLLATLSGAKKEVKLQATSTINIPEIGSFDTTVLADVSKAGIEFQAQIHQQISFANIDITNAELGFSTKTKTIKITGDGTIEGYKVIVELTKDKKNDISAKASLTEKSLSPFSSLHIPVVSDITITDPSFKFIKEKDAYETQLQGNVTIFDIPLTCNLHIKKPSSGKTVTLVEVEAPKDFQLSHGMSIMKGSIFDAITLHNVTFVFCSDAYNDTTRNMNFKKGFNLVAELQLTGILAPVGVFTKTPSDSFIDMQAYIATDNPLNSTFKATIPNGVPLKQSNGGSDIAIGRLQLEVAANPVPEFALLTSLNIKPSAKDDVLTLTARIMFQPPNVTLAGTMLGTWKHPLGIKNIEVSDIAIDIDFGPTFPETGIPAGIGLAGQMGLGSRHLAVALKIPLAGNQDTVLCGALDELNLNDLVDIATRMVGQKTSLHILPHEFAIKDLKVYMAPKTTSIGELTFDQGLTMHGILSVPGFSAMGNLNMSADGLIAQASCSKINYGPLLISRAKEDIEFDAHETTAISWIITGLNDQKANQPLQQNIATNVDSAASTIDSKEQAAPESKLSSYIKKATALAQDVKHAAENAQAPDNQVAPACKPDSALLKEYDGPTMRIVVNRAQPLNKQGIFVSGLFKIGNVIEEDAFFRLDREGIEFDFEAAIGKELYNGEPLLQAQIHGKSSGSLKSPEFNISLDMQQNVNDYILEQVRKGLKTAKITVSAGVAHALANIQASKALNPTEVGRQVDAAERDVEHKRQQVQSLQADVDRLARQIKLCK